PRPGRRSARRGRATCGSRTRTRWTPSRKPWTPSKRACRSSETASDDLRRRDVRRAGPPAGVALGELLGPQAVPRVEVGQAPPVGQAVDPGEDPAGPAALVARLLDRPERPALPPNLEPDRPAIAAHPAP